MGNILTDTSIGAPLLSERYVTNYCCMIKILIPTHDYLTAAGLVRILGEDNFRTLLEEERLRFLRLRGIFGYVRGSGPDGRLLTMLDPQRRRPDSSSIDLSVEAGLSAIRGEYTGHKRLAELITVSSHDIELHTAIDATHRDTYSDLSQTALWRESYQLANPDLLALPGVDQMGVRVIGPGIDISNNIVDACLALGLMNVDSTLPINLRV
jgi:hypothetical protein